MIDPKQLREIARIFETSERLLNEAERKIIISLLEWHARLMENSAIYNSNED
jgi:hypothetical protein